MMQAKEVSTAQRLIKGTNGLRLFVRSWRPTGGARAVVAIVPGFNSHSGYYEWTGTQLADAGLAVHAVDLRGRGQSGAERFYGHQGLDRGAALFYPI
jgi:acylglycerol lipase